MSIKRNDGLHHVIIWDIVRFLDCPSSGVPPEIDGEVLIGWYEKCIVIKDQEIGEALNRPGL
jgi:hypothetical protein